MVQGSRRNIIDLYKCLLRRQKPMVIVIVLWVLEMIEYAPASLLAMSYLLLGKFLVRAYSAYDGDHGDHDQQPFST